VKPLQDVVFGWAPHRLGSPSKSGSENLGRHFDLVTLPSVARKEEVLL
jgi:hypothetical protein